MTTTMMTMMVAAADSGKLFVTQSDTRSELNALMYANEPALSPDPAASPAPSPAPHRAPRPAPDPSPALTRLPEEELQPERFHKYA